MLGQIGEDGFASMAGLQPDDRVTAVDGEPVADWFALVDIIRESRSSSCS